MANKERDHLLWRLRNSKTAKHLCDSAADEIERLVACSRDDNKEMNELREEIINLVAAGWKMPPRQLQPIRTTECEARNGRPRTPRP